MTVVDEYDQGIQVPGVGRGRLTITPRLRHYVLERDEYSCAYCGDMASEIDHISPVIRDGLTIEQNLTAACWLCNAQKRDMSVGEWIAYREARDMPWPPPSRFRNFCQLFDSLQSISEVAEIQRRLDAVLHRHPEPKPWGEWHSAWIKRVHRGRLDSFDVERARLLAAIPDEVNDHGYRYGDVWTDDTAWTA